MRRHEESRYTSFFLARSFKTNGPESKKKQPISEEIKKMTQRQSQADLHE